jgi:hypothetical protein
MNRYEHLSAGTPFRSNEELLLFVDARLAVTTTRSCLHHLGIRTERGAEI